MKPGAFACFYDGFPRFKPKSRYDSFSLGSPAAAAHTSGTLIAGNHVKLPKLGAVRFHQYRPLHGKVLDVIVRREAGRWYVIFQCDLGAAPAKVDVATIVDSRIVGIDVGLTTLAMLSTGEPIANPRHGKAAAKMLAARQRCVARKRRGSRSRRRAVIHVQRAHIHIANCRKDTARKAAADLVRRYDVVCFEDLNVRGLASGMLAKSIHDAAWSTLMTSVACKAESAGTHVIYVNPRGTSQECSGCGNVVKKSLSERVHECPECGLTLDLDHNAAINVRMRGRRMLQLLATQRDTSEGFG